MRALGLYLVGAVILTAGCANPGQPPSLDPFMRPTTVPPPGTGLAAPPSPYIQQNGGTGVAPQSSLKRNRTGQVDAEQAEDETASGWRGADAPKERLVSHDDDQPSRVEAADGEFTASDNNSAEEVVYEEDVESTDNEAPRSNPVRKSPVRIRASQDGAEVGVESE